ncbi:T9SS type A sorting domain-containing protein [Lewinella sp. LCG006]|uniref:T9SS type A sorting domain-containing protein n=1 Tax=Lewinella sp. LCG006 TaxID=3231911 RepID=UPI003461026E
MKTVFTSIIFCLLSLPLLVGQNNVEFNASSNWIGYMNVFNLDGSYNFGSSWEVPALKSTLNTANNTLTLQPNFNTYAENAGDAFWVNQTTGEGAKTMEALTFVEPGATFNGQDLTFSGTVQGYTLDDAYEVKFFIKALDPNNGYADALGGGKVFPLPASGDFSVSATAAELPAGLLIQYGFSVTGRNANPTNEAALGTVTIGVGPSSVNDLNTLQIAMSVFPNPATETLFIKSDAQVQSYQVSTLLGQTVMSGKASKEIDVRNLAAGTYFLTVYAEEGNKVMKFVKN